MPRPERWRPKRCSEPRRLGKSGACHVLTDGMAVDAPTAQRAKSSVIMARKGSVRSEEHTSELQSLMRISYAVFCLKKKKKTNKNKRSTYEKRHKNKTITTEK